MTRRGRTNQSVERRLVGLETTAEARDEERGFWLIQVGGDPDRGGEYTWDDRRKVYVNDAGDEIPPEDAPHGDPDSEFTYTVNAGEARDS